jgi:hypothetical protein
MTDEAHLPKLNTDSVLPEMPKRGGTPRARVKLQRVNSNYSIPCSPDGQETVWWERLKMALGTTSNDFVDATLAQIQNAARLPSGAISETGVNAVLAFIEGAEVRNEVEAALAIQMGCTHAVTMTLLNKLGGEYSGLKNTTVLVSAVARLMKAFATQVETLRRLKHGSSQTVRVEHVHVHDGAQALIGNIKE